MVRNYASIAILLLAGCSSRDGAPADTVAFRGHPSIVLCHDQSAMLQHAPGYVPFGTAESPGAWRIQGLYKPEEDTIYLAARGETLTIPEALYLAHELQHAAEENHHGNLWAVLRDESGTFAEDDNYDSHGHGTNRGFEQWRFHQPELTTSIR